MLITTNECPSAFRVHAFSVFPPRFAVGKEQTKVWTLNAEGNSLLFFFLDTDSNRNLHLSFPGKVFLAL